MMPAFCALVIFMAARTGSLSPHIDGEEADAAARVKMVGAFESSRADRNDAVDRSIEAAAAIYETGDGVPGADPAAPHADLDNDAKWFMRPRRRYSSDGLAMANVTECATIRNAAKLFTVAGRQCITTHVMFDNDSPYTPLETVKSVRSVQAVRMHNGDPARYAAPLATLLTVAARVRAKIMDHFNQTTLYYHLTEIVCRAPREWPSVQACVEQGCFAPCMEGCPGDCMGVSGPAADLTECEKLCSDDCTDRCTASCSDQSWLSHPIHADANPEDCDMLDTGLCVRRLPQDFTTHLYLNDNFEGGDFFFAKDAESGTVDEVIKPTCGKMLAYSSGMENMHGVTGIKSGERCLVTLWLTPDARKAEELPLPVDSPFLDGRVRGPGRGLE